MMRLPVSAAGLALLWSLGAASPVLAQAATEGPAATATPSVTAEPTAAASAEPTLAPLPTPAASPTPAPTAEAPPTPETSPEAAPAASPEAAPAASPEAADTASDAPAADPLATLEATCLAETQDAEGCTCVAGALAGARLPPDQLALIQVLSTQDEAALDAHLATIERSRRMDLIEATTAALDSASQRCGG